MVQAILKTIHQVTRVFWVRYVLFSSCGWPPLTLTSISWLWSMIWRDVRRDDLLFVKSCCRQRGVKSVVIFDCKYCSPAPQLPTAPHCSHCSLYLPDWTELQINHRAGWGRWGSQTSPPPLINKNINKGGFHLIQVTHVNGSRFIETSYCLLSDEPSRR